MKAKHVFTTLGLALTMGLGVAAGLSHVREFKQAKAGDSVTLYFDVTETDWWNNNSAETYAHCFGGSVADTTWPGKKMSLVEGKTTKYSVEIDSTYTKVIFTRVNPADHTTVWNRTSKDGGTAISLPSDYSVSNQWNLTADGSSYDDGNYCGNWSLYTPPAAKYAVDVYVDGVKRGTEQIGEGELPENPSGQYGKRFSGWFDNSECTEGHEVTEITSATTVYGKMITLPTVTYILDQSKGEVGKFAKTNLYAYDAGGHNADWPGVEITGAPKSFTVPNDATLVINAGQDLEQTVNITQSGVANDTLYLLDSVDGEGKYEVLWASDIDAPEKEETYYLVGTETNWKYKNAPEMETDSIYQEDNVAVLFGYAAKAGEEIQVRGVFSGEDKWYGKGGEGGENYVFESAGSYDIYLNSSKNLFVGPAATRHMATITCNKFAGKDLEGSVNKQQIIYEASQFNPSVSIDGYILRGIYTNAEMTTAYTPAVLHADTQLYAKFTKACYYIVGDDAFMGAGHGWNVDYAAEISTDGVNKLAGTVVIPEGASAEHPIAVKPLRFGLQTDGSEDPSGTPGFIAEYYTLGEERTFVELDGDGNFAFSESGTYAIYVNNSNEVYFNIGEYVFHAKFLSEVGAICSGIEAGTKTVDQLKAIWGDQKAAFNALVEGDQNNIKNVGFDGGDEHSSDDRLKMVAKYNRIITKYGTSNFEDFIWKQTIASNDVRLINNTAANNTALVVILVSAVAVISAAGLFLVIRRRKHN